jgi:predicted nucleotidyltransferase
MTTSAEARSRVRDMNRQAVLDRLHDAVPAFRERYRVRSLAVFGSMARGENPEDSDARILVTFEGKPNFDNFIGLKLDLEDMLRRLVDLGTPETLRPEFRARVERELIHVP